MKVAVTGSNGFIGKNLVEYLRNQGHHVLIISRSVLYRKIFLNDFFEVYQPDEVYHLASYGNHFKDTGNQCIFDANVMVLNNLLENGIKFHPSCKLYNFSTSSVHLPVQTMYSITKKMGEMLVNQYKEQNKWNLVNIRPYSVFGPGESISRFIPKVIISILRGWYMDVVEYVTHDWIYVDDFIKAIPFNTEIGTGIKTSNLQVIRMIEKIMGKKLNYKAVRSLRAYDNGNWVCPEPLKEIKPMSLYEGLEKTVEFYKSVYDVE